MDNLFESLINMYNFFKESESKYSVEAYHLVIRLLDIDYTTRITAEEALLHPFFNV